MEIQEFSYIYRDCKIQAKQMVKISSLLKITEKSTKKLECLNLYANAERREFQLEIDEEKMYKSLKSLYTKIQNLHKSWQVKDISIVQHELIELKQKHMLNFDQLSHQQQDLTNDIETMGYLIEEQDHIDLAQVGQADEDQDESIAVNTKKQQNNEQEKLKKEIDEIQIKIRKYNFGKGKWLESDHKDFITIYNKYKTNQNKIISQSIKILGMTNIQIIDHLEVYNQYLEIQKKKKIIVKQYYEIKNIKKNQQKEKNNLQIQHKNNIQQRKKSIQKQQNIKKKEMIKQFKQQKAEQKEIKKQEIIKDKKKIKIPLPIQKQKEIIQRNKKYIQKLTQNNNKKQEEIHNKKSIQKFRGYSIDLIQKNKKIETNQINTSKNKLQEKKLTYFMKAIDQ